MWYATYTLVGRRSRQKDSTFDDHLISRGRESNTSPEGYCWWEPSHPSRELGAVVSGDCLKTAATSFVEANPSPPAMTP
jgi:hypothetical protein